MEVQGFPHYLIYEDGRVLSKKRNKFLKHGKKNKGYLYVVLCDKGKRITNLIHRLVAIHYIPNLENKKEVDHIDRNKTNNNIENLRWVSPQENCENRGMPKTNTSGHTNISWVKSRKKWVFQMRRRNKILKRFNSKIDCLCYKFIFNLKTACKIH